ncbi:hypothetical protein D9615_004812 [Tricholomella constricta]|uniref:Uncharacterized protein n=1 Tax=Tricholomella constricta TaxID=117010 RepID=A0A8H5HH24_9AGAR|nr:hypothetical protein D9615_004812 [Tricholomella constricta]
MRFFRVLHIILASLVASESSFASFVASESSFASAVADIQTDIADIVSAKLTVLNKLTLSSHSHHRRGIPVLVGHDLANLSATTVTGARENALIGFAPVRTRTPCFFTV